MVNVVKKLILKFMMLVLLAPLIGCIQDTQDALFADEEVDFIVDENKEYFFGVTGGFDLTDTTVKVQWDDIEFAHSYTVVDITNRHQPVVIGVTLAPATNLVATGLTINTSYQLAVFVNMNFPYNDKNDQMISFTTLPAPNTPFSIDLIFPAYPRGLDKQPILRIHGTKATDTVEIHKNSSCTDLVTSHPTSSSLSTDIILPIQAIGTYKYYAKVYNSANQYSNCTSVSGDYEVSACPHNYAEVYVNSAPNFCVAKYEMKCSDINGAACITDTDLPAANALGKPWVNISQLEAKAACTRLGANYHLIKNTEWMSMAQELERSSNNWSAGTVGISQSLSRGHSNNIPSTLLDANEDDNFACHGNTEIQATDCATLSLCTLAPNTKPICNKDVWHINRRVHTLDNTDQTVWDVAGNAWEWIDTAVTTDRPMDDYTWYSIQSVVATITFPSDTFQTEINSLTAQNNGVGVYYSVPNTQTTVARRGGNRDHGVGAGIYTLVFREDENDKSAEISFRCAYDIVP
jgi:hypothetical protein